jgi:hypothetical protein
MINRRKFLALLAAAPFVTQAGASELHIRTDLEPTGLNLGNLPPQPWVKAVEHYGTVPMFNAFGKNIYTDILKVTLWNDRFRRVILSKPEVKAPRYDILGNLIQGMRSAFVVALPGSNALGDGAMDLVTGVDGYQHQWPIAVAADNDMIAVMIDGPLWGEWEYPQEQDNAYDILLADICCVEAAKWFFDNSLSLAVYGVQPVTKNMFVGGISWGGQRAMMLQAALKDCVAAYIGSAQMDKAYDTRPFLNPSDWAADNYNYSDVLKDGHSVKTRIMFGGNGGDYLYTPYQPDVDTIVDGVVASDPTRFTKYIAPALGHQIDLADIRSFFQNSMSHPLFYHPPEYQAVS